MKNIIHQNQGTVIDLPGRHLKWIANDEILGAQYLSACIIRVPPGEKVRPAHSHPHGEELIHIIKGSGRVLIDGQVGEVKEGSSILFPKNKVHMLQNTSDLEMKVICFFAPPTSLDNYLFFEGIDFPD